MDLPTNQNHLFELPVKASDTQQLFIKCNSGKFKTSSYFLQCGGAKYQFGKNVQCKSDTISLLLQRSQPKHNCCYAGMQFCSFT